MTKLYTILSNLLENALKFTPRGIIEFGYIKIGSTLNIYVKDNGIGIKKEKQETIFDRFLQEEEDVTKTLGGLGLGLSIAKENTKLIGGKIKLKSKKGEGSTFFITIPYKPTSLDLENSNSTAKSIKENDIHKCTILVAEDEEINYLFLEILLKKEIDLDCNILHAKNGEEAVEISKNNADIDLILMDLKMPIMDGFEAAKQIKELRPNVPIVAQTAFSSVEDKRKVFSLGFDDFLSKPISKEALIAVINKQQKRRGLFNNISK
ncbi:response regulator [Flavobacteriaceae bacterium]|nr:response regulator [Flavobacteriaceae bacterium]